MSKTSKKVAAATAAAAVITTPARTITLPELMWSSTLAGGRRTFAQAEAAVQALDAGGFTDWRLPTLQELHSLVDHARYNPAIDQDQFPDAESALYWSSTPDAENPADYAWGVDFYYGDAYVTDRYLTGFVRAVRSVAPAAPGQ